MAGFWEIFIKGPISNFRKSAFDQIDNCVKNCWAAIIDNARYAQQDLPTLLARVKPSRSASTSSSYFRPSSNTSCLGCESSLLGKTNEREPAGGR